MKINKSILLVLSALALTACGGSKPYGACIRDSFDQIKNVVLNGVYREIGVSGQEPTGEKCGVLVINFSKIESSAADVTLALTDIVAVMGSNTYTPFSFCKAIGDATTEKGSYNYCSMKSTTYTLAPNEFTVIPDCFVCFEDGKLDKTVVIKVKGQEINHDINNPTKISL